MTKLMASTLDPFVAVNSTTSIDVFNATKTEIQQTFTGHSAVELARLLHMSRYALESPVPPADLIALSPGYRVPPDLATIPYAPWHTRFVLLESATLDRMFEMTLSSP